MIDAGARHKLVKLEITGNQYFRTEMLRPRLQVQPGQPFIREGRYTQGLLANDVRGLENLYHTNGFQQIKITPEVVDDYEGHENDLAIKISIDEGPQTRVGAFHIVGQQDLFRGPVVPR